MLLITGDILSDILRVRLNDIDAYLSDRQHAQWQELLQHPIVASNEHRQKKLRSVVIISFKIKFVTLIQSLWETYRQSGIDALQIDSDRVVYPVWPMEIQRLVEEFATLFAEPTTIANVPSASSSPSMDDSRHDQKCLILVDSCLYSLQKRQEHLQHLLAEETDHLSDYEQPLREQVRLFVERALRPIKLEIDCTIELLYSDCQRALYEQELTRNLPTREQVTDLSVRSSFSHCCSPFSCTFRSI